MAHMPKITITVEGPEGVGKTTLIALLANELDRQGVGHRLDWPTTQYARLLQRDPAIREAFDPGRWEVEFKEVNTNDFLLYERPVLNTNEKL